MGLEWAVYHISSVQVGKEMGNLLKIVTRNEVAGVKSILFQPKNKI